MRDGLRDVMLFSSSCSSISGIGGGGCRKCPDRSGLMYALCGPIVNAYGLRCKQDAGKMHKHIIRRANMHRANNPDLKDVTCASPHIQNQRWRHVAAAPQHAAHRL
jgi:hypothetical protein